MSQVSRQNAKTKVEKDFYKLMNNLNFGDDCRNNIDNSSFRPIYDDIEEISYIQKYISLYNNDEYKDFSCPETIKQQVEKDYNSEIMLIKEDDPCAETKLHCAVRKELKKMDSVESMIAKVKRKKSFRDNDQKAIDHLKDVNNKMITDFDCESSVSINSLAVNKTNVVKLTIPFFSGKMIIFANLSLISFIYNMIETFYFPNTKTKIIYRSYGIEKILPYHILTDTNSTALLFQIICFENNSIPDDRFCDIIFEAIVQNDIIERFDSSNKY